MSDLVYLVDPTPLPPADSHRRQVNQAEGIALDEQLKATFIWRVTTEKPTLSYRSFGTLSHQHLVQGLSTLFPQLSTSATSGPSIDRIVKCLSNPQTFTLYLASAALVTFDFSTQDPEPPVLGCLTLVTLDLLMSTRAHIEDLVVLQTCRGLGLGRELMKRAVKDATDPARGCTMVDLTSKPDRVQARALYESLGFTLRDTGAYRYYAPK